MDGWEFRASINGDDCTEFLKKSVPEIADLDNQLATMDREFTLKVADGLAKRDDDGRINAQVSFAGVTKNNQTGMELLGIDEMVFSTKEEFLSDDPDSPTVFETTTDFSLAKGTMIAPLLGDAIPTTTDLSGDLLITALMYKKHDTILGEYNALAEYRIDVPGIGAMVLELKFFGRFSLKLIT